jgi:hypothetical protein
MHQVRKVSRGLASLVDLAVPGKVGPKCSGWRSQGAGKELSDTLSIASRSREARFATNPNNCWGLLRSRMMELPPYRSSVLRPNMAVFLVFNPDHIFNKKLADIGCASRRCMRS